MTLVNPSNKLEYDFGLFQSIPLASMGLIRLVVVEKNPTALSCVGETAVLPLLTVFSHFPMTTNWRMHPVYKMMDFTQKRKIFWE